MWQWLVLVLVAIFAIKFLQVYFFWSTKGIPYENYIRYLYRVIVKFNISPVYEVVREDVKTYGRIYGSYKGMTPSLVVSDVELVKEVLVKQFGNFFKKYFEVNTGDPVWDKQVNQLPYAHWKSVRTVMGYTFTSAKMRAMIPKLDKVAKRLVAKLESKANSGDDEIILRRYLQSYGMDSIAAIAFGIELNCIDDPENPFVRNASNIFKPGLTGIVMLLCPNLIKYLPFLNFPPKETMQFFSKFGKHILEEKRSKLDQAIKNDTADILDHHLIAQRDDPNSGLTDDVLVSQSFLFFLAGNDTTAFALEYLTYYLAINPDVQEKVYQLIKKKLGDRVEFTYEDLHEMPILEACATETLRLMPVLSSLDRICNNETVVAGVTIKKGMLVECPIVSIHYDPLYFPEPEQFHPERFLKDGEFSSETAAFLTFGDGPRNCVGRRLALMNISVLVANILLKMKLERCERTPVPLRLKNGIRFSDMSKDELYIKMAPR